MIVMILTVKTDMFTYNIQCINMYAHKVEFVNNLILEIVKRDFTLQFVHGTINQCVTCIYMSNFKPTLLASVGRWLL